MIPRLESLLHRLETAKDTNGQPAEYLDELMAFLENPPPGVTNRWKQGAEMCHGWGIASTKASVWRLYRSYALEWRLQADNDIDTDPIISLDDKTKKLAALRAFDALADPQLSPAHIISLARIELRKQALQLAREKYLAAKQKKLEMALDAFVEEITGNPEALAAFDQMKKALGLTEAELSK